MTEPVSRCGPDPAAPVRPGPGKAVTGIPVYLGLGSNLGDRERLLSRARRLLEERGALHIDRRSDVIETQPVGPPQPRYLNQIVRGRTLLGPRDLLEIILGIEEQLGRQRGGVRWGPRLIDIDILDYGGRVLTEPGLTLPHPEIARREFVLRPWAEVDPDHRLPGLERSIAELLGSLEARP